MRFYGRKKEITLLEESYSRVGKSAQMIVITGRRRMGKTVLSLHYSEKKPHLYLFVSKKSEFLLCQEFVNQIKLTFDVPVIGEITQFKDIFALLLELAKIKPFVLIIDEFQEFYYINPSVYSDIQKLWDLNKFTSKIQVLFLGSIYSLMHKIFEESKEPLFGRQDRMITLRPFSIQDMSCILKDYDQNDLETLFHYYMFTGGTPKYIDLFLSEMAFSLEQMIDCMLSDNSPFLNEGKNLLIEEFGKEYGNYFSILELISVGKTSRGEIESILQKDVGGFLEKLENDYFVISRYKPINAKPETKLIKYKIKDHFLRFWFRYIYRNRTAVETGNFDYIKRVLEADLATFSGLSLEQFFQDLFADSHQYNQIGSYFEPDHTNEIDLVAINDLDKKLIVAEVKRNKKRISLDELKRKAKKLLLSYADYDVKYLALSLSDAQEYLPRS
ncbi:MAG: ATP-binding protein [Verrucomicrobia bacterium]|nr:ATP-binding protein [Verrucomicrobiota bacterium]MBS0636795.1 ATP-binding protein [Verrucomicrobiota bacterium]